MSHNPWKKTPENCFYSKHEAVTDERGIVISYSGPLYCNHSEETPFPLCGLCDKWIPDGGVSIPELDRFTEVRKILKTKKYLEGSP